MREQTPKTTPCKACQAIGGECRQCYANKWAAKYRAIAEESFGEPVKTTATVKVAAEIESKPLFGGAS